MSEEQETQKQTTEGKDPSGKKVIKGIAIGGAIGSLIALIFAHRKITKKDGEKNCPIKSLLSKCCSWFKKEK